MTLHDGAFVCREGTVNNIRIANRSKADRMRPIPSTHAVARFQ